MLLAPATGDRLLDDTDGVEAIAEDVTLEGVLGLLRDDLTEGDRLVAIERGFPFLVTRPPLEAVAGRSGFFHSSTQAGAADGWVRPSVVKSRTTASGSMV